MEVIKIRALPLDSPSFQPFGDVIEAGDRPDMLINEGRCQRFHDLARLEARDGRLGVSLFRSELAGNPHQFSLMERHPKGSQAFIPMSPEPYLVTVARDEGGRPGIPQAFVTRPLQGINLLINTWHGVLTPLSGPGVFAVIDRIGETTNLEEYVFENKFEIQVCPP